MAAISPARNSTRTSARSTGRPPTTIENALEAAKIGGVDITVISNPIHNLRDMDPQQQFERCQRQNRFNAECQNKYHGQIVGMASTVPYGGDKFLREFERAIKAGRPQGRLDHCRACRATIPTTTRPCRSSSWRRSSTCRWSSIRRRSASARSGCATIGLASSIGRPMDGALAISRLIVRGVFEKFPKLKLVGTHLGGGICEMIGRMNYAYRLQDEAFFLGSYEPMLIKHEPLHYLKMMYLESTCYHPPGARCAIDTVGVDHFLFGTDSPPLFVLKQEGVDLINKLGLTPEEKDKVYYQNAKKLLKL